MRTGQQDNTLQVISWVVDIAGTDGTSIIMPILIGAIPPICKPLTMKIHREGMV
jgi:hypothetical protein